MVIDKLTFFKGTTLEIKGAPTPTLNKYFNISPSIFTRDRTLGKLITLT